MPYAPLQVRIPVDWQDRMTNITTTIGQAAAAAWHWLRGFTGDAAYEGYLRHAARCSDARLTAQQFYLQSMQRKYTRPNRCC